MSPSQRRKAIWKKSPLGKLFELFCSLRLTVTLLALSIALVFFGTLDQVHIGIYGAQQKYFEHVLAIWQYPHQWPLGSSLSWLHFPIPGGYLVGPLLIVNLVCAHLRYFRLSWRKAGIALIHVGVVLLLVGQLLTNLLQEESYMTIDEGSQANYTESFRNNELVVIDKSDPDKNRVLSIPTSLIEELPTLQHPHVPIKIKVESFYRNATIFRRGEAPQMPVSPINRGLGKEMDLAASEIPLTYKQDERNNPCAIVILAADGETLGTWLLSTAFREQVAPQTFTHAGRDYEIALRSKRKYLPYQIELIDFSHDLYPGTEIPKNYSSLVRIRNPEVGIDRQTLIYMNNPLRYEGLAFFQYSFANNDTTTIFQVVRNPGWLIPYISVILVTAGLLTQFGYHLIRFLREQRLRAET